jgi:hypothetical protein
MGKLFLLALVLVFSTIAIRADEATRRAQEELRKRNLYFGDVDGRTNPELVEALKHYQKRKGFEQSGGLNEETANSLKIRISPTKTDSERPLPDVPVLKSDAARELAEPDRAALQTEMEQESTPSPSPTPSPAEPLANPEQIEHDKITNFVRRYLRDAQANDVDLQVNYFAFPVEYFDHGRASREFVVKDTRNYIHRWPQRKYMLLEPVKLGSGSKPGERQIEFTIAFQVADGNRIANGKTRNLWTIQPDAKNFKILVINEQRLHD